MGVKVKPRYHKLCSPSGREKITAFFENCRDESKVSIDMIYSEFVEIFTFCATNSSAALSKKKRKRTSKKTKSWYTSECKILKSAINRAEKNYRKEPFNRGLLQKLIKAKREFQSKCKESEKMLRIPCAISSFQSLIKILLNSGI